MSFIGKRFFSITACCPCNTHQTFASFCVFMNLSCQKHIFFNINFSDCLVLRSVNSPLMIFPLLHFILQLYLCIATVLVVIIIFFIINFITMLCFLYKLSSSLKTIDSTWLIVAHYSFFSFICCCIFFFFSFSNLYIDLHHMNILLCFPFFSLQ